MIQYTPFMKAYASQGDSSHTRAILFAWNEVNSGTYVKKLAQDKDSLGKVAKEVIADEK
jgi:hypothetical protein